MIDVPLHIVHTDIHAHFDDIQQGIADGAVRTV